MNKNLDEGMKEMPTDGYSTKLPEDVRKNLSAYRANDSLLARENLFQALRAKDSKLADSQVGQDSFKGYNGIFNAFNKAYGVSDEEQQAIDKYTEAMNNKKNGQMSPEAMQEMANMQQGQYADNNSPMAGAIPGGNTVSSLGILQYRK